MCWHMIAQADVKVVVLAAAAAESNMPNTPGVDSASIYYIVCCNHVSFICELPSTGVTSKCHRHYLPWRKYKLLCRLRRCVCTNVMVCLPTALAEWYGSQSVAGFQYALELTVVPALLAAATTAAATLISVIVKHLRVPLHSLDSSR